MSVFTLAEKPVAEQIATIQRGLPGSALRQIVAAIGLSQKAIVEALGLSPRTVALRMSRGQAFSAAESERFLRLVRVRRLAREIFASDEAVSEWLQAGDPALGGRSPLEMLATDLGAAQVEHLLRAMIQGVPL